MATETKKVSKLDEVLNKIDAFFTNLMSAKKEGDDMEEDDDLGAETTTAEAEPAPAAKATDDEDSQDPDDDGDDDSDPDKDDDDDAYGKKADAEIAALKATVKKQNALLKEAQVALAERDTDVRETIKSTFKPTGSQRSTKKAVEAEPPSFAVPTTDMGKRAVALANKRK